MVFENSPPGYIPLSDYDEDVCEGLTEDECKGILDAVDVTMVMAALDCTSEDMEAVIEQLAELLDGERAFIDYTCASGGRIIVQLDRDERLVIETDPPVELD